MYCGEEDFLANYLMVIKDGKHGFSIPNDMQAFLIPEGDWVKFESSPQRAAQMKADKISYTWDSLIETFNNNILGGTSYDGAPQTIPDRERIMRFLAGEPRIRRRMLAELLVGLIRNTKANQRGTRVILPSNSGDPYYCFLVLPHLFGRSEEEYREVRAHLLEALCLVTKLMYPDSLDIVGVATDQGLEAILRSEDALYLNARVWNAELEAHARYLQAEHRLLTNTTEFNDKVFEFPLRSIRM